MPGRWVRDVLDGNASILAAGLVAIAAFAASVAGASGPEPARVLLAFVAVVLVPGYGLARLLVSERDAEWPEWLAVSVGLGLGAHAALAWIAQLAGRDPIFELWALPALGIVSLAFSSRPRRAPAATQSWPGGTRGERAWAWIALAAALGAAIVWVAALGPPLGLLTDSPDHLATIRRLALDGRVLVPDVFHPAEPGAAFDPRKGLYHSLLALVTRAADVDPATTWRWVAAVFAPFFGLASYCLARRAAASQAAGALAAGLVLVAQGSPGLFTLREAAYPMHVADALALLVAWAGLGALSAPGRRRVVLAAALAFAAVTTHLFAGVQAAFFLVAIVVGVWLGYRHLPLNVLFRSKRRWLLRAATLGAGLALACVPYMLHRIALAGGAHDPLHAEPQGLLYWWGNAFTVDPRLFFSMVGWPGAALLAALPLLWRRRHEGLGPAYLAAAAVVTLAVALDPLVLPVVHRALGYLVFRLAWCVPVIPALGVAIVLGARAFFHPAAPATRGLAALALGAIAIGLASPVLDAASALARGTARARPEPHSAARRMATLEALRTRWPGPRVLVADPLTSYAIPAWTGHHVVAVLDQHGTPVDARAPERRQAARDALSPFVGMRRTLAGLRRERVDAVVLDDAISEPFAYQGGAWLPELSVAVRRKFQARPEYFRAHEMARGVWVFELTDAARRGPLPPAGEPPLPFPVRRAEAVSSHRIAIDREAAFDPLRARIESSRAAPGESLRVTALWRRRVGEDAPYGFYVVAMVLEDAAPGGPLYRAGYGKLYRSVLESLSGTRRRMLAFHLPVGGLVPPDQWPVGAVVEDRFTFPVHPRAAPGSYRVRLRLLRLPPYPNTSLADLLSDQDRLAGPVVGRVVITPARTAAR